MCFEVTQQPAISFTMNWLSLPPILRNNNTYKRSNAKLVNIETYDILPDIHQSPYLSQR